VLWPLLRGADQGQPSRTLVTRARPKRGHTVPRTAPQMPMQERDRRLAPHFVWDLEAVEDIVHVHRLRAEGTFGAGRAEDDILDAARIFYVL